MLFILGNPYYTHSQYGKVDLTKVKEDYPLLKEGKLFMPHTKKSEPSMNLT